MCWLRQHSPTLQQKTELPRSPALLALLLIHNNSVKQPASAHLRDKGGAQVAYPTTEELAESKGTLGEPFVDEYREGSHGYCTAEGVAEKLVEVRVWRRKSNARREGLTRRMCSHALQA